DFDKLAVSGLASMYQTSDWSIMLRATMDISARTRSLPERPQRTIWVTSVRMRREDRTSVSSHPLADLGGEIFDYLRTITRLETCLLRRRDHEQARPRRCARACWQVQSQGHCGVAAFWLLRSRALAHAAPSSAA